MYLSTRVRVYFCICVLVVFCIVWYDGSDGALGSDGYLTRVEVCTCVFVNWYICVLLYLCICVLLYFA